MSDDLDPVPANDWQHGKISAVKNKLFNAIKGENIFAVYPALCSLLADVVLNITRIPEVGKASDEIIESATRIIKRHVNERA